MIIKRRGIKQRLEIKNREKDTPEHVPEVAETKSFGLRVLFPAFVCGDTMKTYTIIYRRI